MDVTVEGMEKRVARWGKVKPYEQTFIESRLPGFEKRLYKIINRGVLENKGVQPAIPGFTPLRGYPHRGPGRTGRKFAFS
jgi:hypothetical protein